MWTRSLVAVVVGLGVAGALGAACGKPAGGGGAEARAGAPDEGGSEGADALGSGSGVDAAATEGGDGAEGPVPGEVVEAGPVHVSTLELPGPVLREVGPLAAHGGEVDEAARWAFERLAPNHPQQRFLEVLMAEVDRSTGKRVSAEAADEAVGRLVAALAQLLDDEDNGRDRVQASPFWGVSGSSERRELREKLVQLIRSRHGERPAARLEAVVAWLLFEERDWTMIEQGLTMLERLPSAARRSLGERILCEANPVKRATMAAIEVVDGSASECVGQRIGVLTAHPDEALAKRAKAKTKARAAEYPVLGALVDALSGLVPFSLGGRELEVVEVRYPGNARVTRWTGAVLEEGDEVLRIGTVHGTVERVVVGGGGGREGGGAEVARVPTTIDAILGDVAVARASSDRDFRAGILSSRGMLTGQFDPGYVSGVELIVAEALVATGRRAEAMAVLAPRLAELPDERWLDWGARGVLGQRVHEEMLARWTLRRDIAGALELAERLCDARFEGYTYRARSCLVRDQLALRLDDFGTFSLPTRAQWEATRGGLSREQQLVYLAERVRLLNTRQWGQPGGVDFMDPQYDRSLERMDLVAWEERSAYELVHPLAEIKAMIPDSSERAVLGRYASSPALMAMYSYWRDFHPARSLHTVGEAITWLLGELDKPMSP